ncbi:MAG: Anaphase-promoting complex, cyclosome, subunit 3 [Acidobacteriota bacterium]|jgi:tetratricopeptide (TPR) repeat protein|nr:Anaphase-promoting complex, cyclosome, subunit 3 [Acidobacteriota bacterium]
MSNVRGKIFCQRCKSANELGEDLCGRCGTRLMLMVEPSAARFEGRAVAGGMEEHLLERVTAIENNISRVIDKLEKMAELMLKQSRSVYFDHALLDTLVTVLDASGVVSRLSLEEGWRERRRGAAEDEGGEPKSPREELCESVLAQYSGEDRETFALLVRDGFAVSENVKASVRLLERAAALAPDNAPLNRFLGEHFFRKGRTMPARDYLARALVADPESGRLHLLLGLACGDEGESERARVLLVEAVRRVGSSFAAHCALGRLAAAEAEADWKAALTEFKLALAARACPEAHYLLGLACFNLGRDRTALRHLSKAVGLDEAYGAAFYLLGLVQLRLGERDEAARAFESARVLDPEEPRYLDACKNLSRAAKAPAPSLFEHKGRGSRRLVTGGDERLAAALRADALGNA